MARDSGVAGITGRAWSLARTLDFEGRHPRAFGAPRASTTPLTVGSFTGDVTRGGSCNCRSVTLVPHCNGTHTESAAHLTREPLDLAALVPLEPLPGLLLHVSVEACDGDAVITASALERQWRATDRDARVLVLRTGVADEVSDNPPYVSLAAMELIVARGIDHLVVDLPSVDRADDGGRLAAHRVFFGLPDGSTRLADARRPHATITELAAIPHDCPTGACYVQLQVTPWTGDAVPSRPVLFEGARA
ncbi:MAG: cyclase family protein [Steroidobacteraceae bacterium]